MPNDALTALVSTHALRCSISDGSMLMTERPHDTINSLQTSTLLSSPIRPNATVSNALAEHFLLRI